MAYERERRREKRRGNTKTIITSEHSPNWDPPNNTAPQCINRCCGKQRPGALINLGITDYQLPLLEIHQASFQLKALTRPARKKIILM